MNKQDKQKLDPEPRIDEAYIEFANRHGDSNAPQVDEGLLLTSQEYVAIGLKRGFYAWGTEEIRNLCKAQLLKAQQHYRKQIEELKQAVEEHFKKYDNWMGNEDWKHIISRFMEEK